MRRLQPSDVCSSLQSRLKKKVLETGGREISKEGFERLKLVLYVMQAKRQQQRLTTYNYRGRKKLISSSFLTKYVNVTFKVTTWAHIVHFDTLYMAVNLTILNVFVRDSFYTVIKNDSCISLQPTWDLTIYIQNLNFSALLNFF